jgi:hypothetical protein
MCSRWRNTTTLQKRHNIAMNTNLHARVDSRSGLLGRITCAFPQWKRAAHRLSVVHIVHALGYLHQSAQSEYWVHLVFFSLLEQNRFNAPMGIRYQSLRKKKKPLMDTVRSPTAFTDRRTCTLTIGDDHRTVDVTDVFFYNDRLAAL